MQEQQTTKRKAKISDILDCICEHFGGGAIFLWQFLSGAYMSNGFYDGTTINGVDVSNLTSEQASNIIAAKLNEKEMKLRLN